MEATLLLRFTDLKELEDFVKTLQAFPAIRKSLKFEMDVEELAQKAEALRAEIQQLENQKASLHTPAVAEASPPTIS
jgi:predicted ATP-grasp superfamily ATP-dependent carboligase